ncbi:MAG: LPXTG cell wall anchor domain-containing protein [Pseudolabrys sp.]|nr:LPXTG cell wall anchor domain-containing protein [Pseudolabrys sp.]
MTTDTQGGMNMNQILLWLGIIIVALAAVYYFI